MSSLSFVGDLNSYKKPLIHGEFVCYLTYMKRRWFSLSAGLFLVGSGLSVLYIVQKIEDSSLWANFIYFYGLGIPLFIVCCIYVVLKKAVRFQKNGNQLNFYLMIFIFSLFVTIHALWTYGALSSSQGL